MIDEGQRWAQVEALFDALWELDPAQRDARIGEIADPAVAAEVRAMFSAAALDERWLAPGAASPAAAPPRLDAPPIEVGRRIGAWRIVGLIGRGGMGEVYRAERADGQFRKPVALKLARAEATLRPEQFDNERQILATLEHPGIARLIDGGLSDESRPYMVMELVEGLDLLAHCDARALPLAARLALFIQVCDAVDHAHRHLVVHRDLKPGNILVSTQGDVKLLDFGIAKLLESGIADQRTATLMTPEYAAPEQLEGRPVTTATDVFALGVLLHQLLAGKAPWNLRELPIPAALQRLLHADPEPLVAAAASNPARPVPPELLAGDLQAIVAKALRREPEARYVSPSALAQDLRRHLAHEPVAARGQARGYLARRFVRRHRVVVSAVAAVMLALVLGLSATAWQARVALREARKSQSIKDFVVNILDANDPNDSQGRGERLTARQILDRAAVRLDSSMDDQPDVKSELASTIGSLYFDFGIYDRSLALLKESAELHDRQDDALDVRSQAWSDVGDSQRILGLYADAALSFRRALALSQRAASGDSVRTAALLVELGDTYEVSSDLAMAEQVLDRAEAMSARLAPGDPQATAPAATGLALVYRDEGRLKEAETLLRALLARAEKAHAGAHSAVSTVLHELGVTLLAEGRFGEAETVFRRALAMHEELLGRAHPHYAIGLTYLGEVLVADGRPAQAEPLLRESLPLRQKAFGPASPKVANAWRVLAIDALALGRLDEAEANARTALKIRQDALAPRHADIGVAQETLAAVLLAHGRAPDAERAARDALDIARSHAPASGGSLAVARSLALLGRVLGREGRFDEALAQIAQASRELPAALGDAYFLRAEWLADQGRFQRAAGQPVAALASLESSLAIARAAYRSDHPAIADTLVPLGELLAEQGQPGPAHAALQEALALRTKAWPAGDARIAEAEHALAALAATRTHVAPDQRR